jgi:hypothetical protein
MKSNHACTYKRVHIQLEIVRNRCCAVQKSIRIKSRTSKKNMETHYLVSTNNMDNTNICNIFLLRGSQDLYSTGLLTNHIMQDLPLDCMLIMHYATKTTIIVPAHEAINILMPPHSPPFHYPLLEQEQNTCCTPWSG